MDAKKIAANRAVDFIKDGMTVGLGSGSTALYAIKKVGERVSQGLKIKAVATSRTTEMLAKQFMIPVYDPSEIDRIDIAIDGADQVDKKGNLIKGGGGSLLREKIIAFASEKFYVIIDDSKLREKLGGIAIPVEIIPFGETLTFKHMKAMGGDPVIRKVNEKTFITDNGHLIADCKFENIEDPALLDVKLKMIPGVIETGLFSSKIVTTIFSGSAGGAVAEIFINEY